MLGAGDRWSWRLTWLPGAARDAFASGPETDSARVVATSPRLQWAVGTHDESPLHRGAAQNRGSTPPSRSDIRTHAREACAHAQSGMGPTMQLTRTVVMFCPAEDSTRSFAVSFSRLLAL